MLDDDKDKYEGTDDSEYHFSDEEVNYEVEPEETSKAAPQAGEPKENLIEKLTRQKRLIISILVFFGLIFVVYKMVSPTASVPSTDITPTAATTTVARAPAVPTPPEQSVIAVKSAEPQAPAAPVTLPGTAVATTAAPQMMAAPTGPTPIVSIPPTTPAAAVPTTQLAPTTPGGLPPPGAVAQTQGVVVQTPAAVAQTPGVVAQTPAAVGQTPGAVAQTISQGTTPPVAIEPQTIVPSTQVQQPMTSVQAPIVVPTTVQTSQLPTTGVQTSPVQISAPPQQTPPSMPQMQGVLPVQSIASETGLSPTPTTTKVVDEKIIALQAESDKAINQLQMEYSRKLGDFSSQNKALADEVQTLNSRVANMENQLNQLLKALTRQSEEMAPPPPRVQAVEQKISYNVQAIIPGRAWLRNDNGETLTVAEGDLIRDLGRVAKIDPYDGVVQINTGQKLISLSYGNGG